MQDEIFLVTARRLQNFRERGHTPPADAHVMPCVHCGAVVIVSAGAAAKIAARLAAGGAAAAICTPCMLQHVPKIEALEVSEQGAALIERNPEVVEHSGVRARDILAELIRRTEK